MSSDHTKRHAHEDARNEVARHARHEAEIRRIEQERGQRRMQPCLNTGSRPSDDFDGCVE